MQLIPSLEWTFTFLLLLNFFNCINTESRHTRNENIESCLDNFDVHKDKIIRTQDSRAMGAKYLSERDVNSRDECLRLCCETEYCDVFVFEERSPGSCYLFQCGSPDDFKCKFTKHQNYTSAVLAVDRQLAELESQIKLTQHEHELIKLREPVKNFTSSTSSPPRNLQNKEVEQYLQTPNERKECSQYQFQCHTSKECIAIYNACDGIPQCADGSDEAAALNCPSQRTLPPPTQPPVNRENYKIEGHPEHQEAMAAEGMLKNWQHQNYEIPQIQNPAPNQIVNVPMQRAYGREGEGIPNYRQDPQWNDQYQQNPGMSQIFTHKGNGLVPLTDRYQQPQRPFVQPHVSSRNMAPYNEQGPDNKYYYENGPYKMFPQNQPQNWQPPRRNEEGRVEPQPNVVPPDYYYEDAYRNRQPYGQKFEPNPLPEKAKIEPTTVHTTPKPVKEDKVHQSHRKVEKLTAESKSRETEEIYGHSTTPSGAILSLSMGLCITAIMVVLVGCRMRMVRRRMRIRGGKSGYAHDADFLVNGMYL